MAKAKQDPDAAALRRAGVSAEQADELLAAADAAGERTPVAAEDWRRWVQERIGAGDDPADVLFRVRTA